MNWKALIISHVFVVVLVVGLAVTRVLRYQSHEDSEYIQEIEQFQSEPDLEAKVEETSAAEPLDELPPPPPPSFADLAPASNLADLRLPNPEIAIAIDLQTDTFAIEQAPAPLMAKQPVKVSAKLSNQAKVPVARFKSSVGLSELDSTPTQIKKGSMRWPRGVRARSVEALVKVELNEVGEVRLIEIVSIDDERLVTGLKSYINSTRFTVPKKDGKPQKVRFNWPLSLQK